MALPPHVLASDPLKPHPSFVTVNPIPSMAEGSCRLTSTQPCAVSWSLIFSAAAQSHSAGRELEGPELAKHVRGHSAAREAIPRVLNDVRVSAPAKPRLS